MAERQGKIYREPSPREVPRIELFFDLTFVAVIHQLADAAVEEPSGDAVARFVLTFWPSWSIWEEARKFSNISGTDDVSLAGVGVSRYQMLMADRPPGMGSRRHGVYHGLFGQCFRYRAAPERRGDGFGPHCRQSGSGILAHHQAHTRSV